MFTLFSFLISESGGGGGGEQSSGNSLQFKFIFKEYSQETKERSFNWTVCNYI